MALAFARSGVSVTPLDDSTATVPNTKLSQVACDSQEIESLETKQPA